MKRFFALGLLAFASMAGCSAFWEGASGGISKNLPCNPPAGVQDALIYPASGSTGIPDNLSEVIFATSSLTGLSQYNAHFSDDTSLGTYQVDFGLFQSWNTPIPQPAATPPFSDITYNASINSGGTGTGTGTAVVFPQGHTIRVQLKHGTCTPVDFGTFTVQ
jgi:hypothetical protein